VPLALVSFILSLPSLPLPFVLQGSVRVGFRRHAHLKKKKIDKDIKLPATCSPVMPTHASAPSLDNIVLEKP
jgi:hypothetical protein